MTMLILWIGDQTNCRKAQKPAQDCTVSEGLNISELKAQILLCS